MEHPYRFSGRKNIKVYFIHGNLQHPSVWMRFEKELSSIKNRHTEFIYENLWNSSADSIDAWTDQFCSKVDFNSNTRNILIGYSLGGRLALHAVLRTPEIWDSAIVIAAHPGFPTLLEKEQCLKFDLNWSRRFLTESLNNLFKDWDSQVLFGGCRCNIERNLSNFDPQLISKLFIKFSKGKQDYLTPKLLKCSNVPITYISGSKDSKYCDIGKTMAQCPSITHKTVPDSCHRVPWENEADFIKIVKGILS